GDTATFTFSTGSVLAPAGAFSIDAWTALLSDIDNTNDSSNLGITIFSNPTVALGADITICSGFSVTLNTSNFGFSSYLWNTGASDSTITVSLGGSYSLTVTDGNGCNGSDTISVTINPAIVLTTATTDASCAASDGTASVSAAGGTGPYAYLWNDPGAQTNDTATGLSAASYTVIVTDALGCLDSATVVVSNTGAPTVTATGLSNISCAGGSDGSATVSVTGGTAPFTFLWNDPGAQINDTATGLTASTFTVTVTDNLGCIDTDNVTLTEPTALALTASSTNSNCGQSDGSVTVGVTGGTGVYTYLWDDSGAQITATAINLPFGTYNVTVTDGNACTDFTSATIVDVAGGVASISATTNASCNGVCDGAATAAIAGGTAPFTYAWNDPSLQTNATAAALCAGTFSVTITDSNGCSDIATATITEPGAMTLTTASVDATCGNPDGSASVSVVGGTAPYTYLWNDPGTQTSDTATGLNAGAFLVIVTDATGCLDSNVATVNNAGGPTATITASTNVLCNGNATGDATVSATGGTLPYTYLWSDPSAQTNAIAAGLTAGLYTVTVTDGNTCISTDFVTLTEALPLSSSTSGVDESCVGSCNGSATVVAGGGTGPITFLWDDPGAQTSSVATGLCAGTYTVIITDANGCTKVDSSIINSGAGFTATASAVSASCGASDGSTSVSITGGTAPFTYLWNDPAAQTNANAIGLAAGIYTVLVTDANGCTNSPSATVTNIGAPAASVLSSTDVLCNGGVNGDATVSATGGTGAYTYLWDDSGAQTTITAVGLAAGTYNVSVTDLLGCTGTASVTIIEPTALASTTSKTDATCNGVCDGTATVAVTGGTAPYVYLWDDPSAQTNSVATGLCAGTFNVAIVDNNGCTVNGTVTITEPVAIGLTTSVVDASCVGADGSVTVTATLGVAPYLYLWNDPAAQTTAVAANLSAGSYTVIVTDANGCTATSTDVVGTSAGPSVTTTGTDASCLGCLDGTATANATGGTTPYTYLWDDPGAQTTATANGLGAGTYNVIVTDASGCTANGSVTITEPASNVFSLNVVRTDVVCNGECNGIATAILQNGTAPFAYQWDDLLSQTTAAATGLCIGTYNVTVTDDTGAVLLGTVTIFQPSAIEVTPVVTGATCGSSDGSISLTVTGGTPGYLYAWSSGGTTSVESGLLAGIYSVTVTDANACTTVKSITVGNANGPTVSVSSTNILCLGNDDGTATASVTGGTSPYTYLWNDPAAQTSATANGLTVGTYSVIVTDAGGCVNTSSTVSVTEPSAILVSTSMVDATAACNGSGTVTASGGTPPYTYTWNDPNSQTTAAATSLCPGSFSVTVEDANGCTTSGTGTVGSTVGIFDQVSDAGFVLYPNPTTDVLWIEHHGSNLQWDLMVYDFTGKVILTKTQITNTSISIKLGELPGGIYLAKITSSTGRISSHRIILE
ncbi:MAG: T9SS type A sorting domain-containing protein, partial [Flavobacteriales bacterium]|nr:T9SS type A sorting domain-containing protein [Flavobacteriales bacterium]